MESSAFIISGPVRMDLHFKCMLNVISKLELIETFENVDVHSGLVEDGMGWPIWCPTKGGGSGKQPHPVCTLYEPWAGHFIPLPLGFLISKRNRFKPNELYNFSLLKNN